jgi:DNA-binding Lrp family transcriptional regulator
MELSESDRRLVAAIQDGLPLAARPFAEVGARCGLTEAEVVAGLERLRAAGVVKRFGIVVRHHELGYNANAMVVWDVPDERVDEVGRRLGEADCVTLCYRRPRRPPEWPYNLFCMIHGRRRETVLAQLDRLTRDLGLGDLPRAVLFSGRRFKQRGARYAPSSAEAPLGDAA